MGWAEHRVEKYQKGEGANWLEKRMLEHANPVYFALAVAAAVCLGYGLWMHNWPAISVAALLALFGHTYCRTRYPESTGSGAGTRQKATTTSCESVTPTPPAGTALARWSGR